MNWKVAVLIIATTASVICAAGVIYAFQSGYDDGFEEEDVTEHFVAQFLESSTWSGSTWRSSIEMDVSNCSHSLYISVMVTGLSVMADGTIVNVYVDGVLGSAEVGSGTATVSGFIYSNSDGDGKFTVRAVLPDGVSWPGTAVMTVTAVAGIL